jgi:hypothetical protein
VLRQKRLSGFNLALVVALGLIVHPANATMPRNPERLLDVKTCKQAKLNLKEARRGSPLISPQKNAKIVLNLEQSVKRLCVK